MSIVYRIYHNGRFLEMYVTFVPWLLTEHIIYLCNKTQLRTRFGLTTRELLVHLDIRWFMGGNRNRVCILFMLELPAGDSEGSSR
jgi:hypothetical protein